MKRNLIVFALIIFPVAASMGQKGKPVDSEATRETKALYKNLKKLSKKHSLFGHQHATEYGRLNCAE